MRNLTLTNVAYPLNPSQLAPVPFSLAPPLGFVTAYDPQLSLPRTYEWNIALEQAVGAHQSLQASYVGAAGRRLLRTERLFATAGLPPGLFSCCIDIIRNTAISDYNSLQIQFQRRVSKGLQALASYAWSRSLDTASSDSSSLTPAEKLDPSTDRGPSDFDITQALKTALTYNIPSAGGNGFSKALLNDWSVDTILGVRSATPVNVTFSRNIGFGSFSFRPDLVAGAPLYLDDPLAAGGRRINPAAFTVPSTPRQGTLGRNALRGFSVNQIDLALRREFPLGERAKLQFRAELFNVLNHPNFADPSGSLGSVNANGALSLSSLFGRSTQMLGRSLGGGGTSGGFTPLYQIGGPRSAQLALKIQF